MVEMNADRIESIYTFWLHWPPLELFWALIMLLVLYMEPAMIGVFLRGVAKGLKSDVLEEKAMTIMKLGFSQMFIQMAYMILALCGTSEVLLTVLRFVYMIGMGFFIGQLVYTAMACFSVPGIVVAQLGDQYHELLEKEETPAAREEEVDEDEEEVGAPAKGGRR